MVFNSRKAIAGAIINLLGFFNQDFCYDHDVTITSNLLFVHSFMQSLSGASFLVFIRVMKFLVRDD